jgi:hypothetical protein
MCVCVCTNITYSDKQEEEKIFGDIIKLVPTFKDLINACYGHRRAFLNLLKMVTLFIIMFLFYLYNVFLCSSKMPQTVRGTMTSAKQMP